jgi:D-ribose pyranose/furanose isomerase RbsD
MEAADTSKVLVLPTRLHGVRCKKFLILILKFTAFKTLDLKYTVSIRQGEASQFVMIILEMTVLITQAC